MELKPTAYVILGILAIHPRQSGYDIRKTVQQSVGFFWGESYGQIYPTLKQLAAAGLIQRVEIASQSRKPRNEFSITPAGQERLRQWLAVPFEDDPPRNQFLLKLFFAESAGPAVAMEQVRQFQANARRFLATIQALLPGADTHGAQFPGFPYWMLTLDYGMRQLQAALDWSEYATETIKRIEAGLETAADASKTTTTGRAERPIT